MDLPRQNLLAAFTDFAGRGSGIVIGPPGVGKTHLLRSYAAMQLEAGGMPIYIPVDRLGVEDEASFERETGLGVPLMTALEDAHASGWVLIDSLDAARSDHARNLYLRLARRIVASESWRVVVSVRTFDATRSPELQDIFPSASDAPPSARYQSAGVLCRHFTVPPLTEAEVEEAVGAVQGLSRTYDRASPDLRALLTIPFNLWLLERLFAAGVPDDELSSIGSEVELLTMFWQRRVAGGVLASDKLALTRRVTREMVSARSLSVQAEPAYSHDYRAAWDDLLSQEVLITEALAGARVAYSHNILFDFAVSVLLLPDTPDALTRFIEEDPPTVVFLRPSLVYYLTRLWNENRPLFWAVFTELSGATSRQIRLVGRTLPAAVVVSEARELDDVAPLITDLTTKAPAAEERVVWILHALRTVGVERRGLWAKFLAQCSRNLAVTFAWDVATLAVSLLEETQDADRADVMASVGQAGRNILRWVLDHRDDPTFPLDRLGSSWGVALVARTFATDRRRSAALLREVVALLHRPGFPIDYLFRLTSEIKAIWREDAILAGAVYDAAFSLTETSEEKTQMGWPVIPLTSTRRQDFDACRYGLVEEFASFLTERPTVALGVGVRAVNSLIAERYAAGPRVVAGDDDVQPLRFRFRKKLARYARDGSYIWDHAGHREYEQRLTAAVVDYGLDVGARQNSSEDRVALLLDTYAATAVAAFLWRRLLVRSAELEQPPLELIEVCSAPPILAEAETTIEAAAVIRKLGGRLSDAQHLTVEKRIMALGRYPNLSLRAREQRRDALLEQLDPQRLQTAGAKRRMEERAALPAPTEVRESDFEALTRFEPYSDEDWLTEQGADLASTANARLLTSLAALRTFVDEHRNRTPEPPAVHWALDEVGEALRAIEESPDADASVKNQVWTYIGSAGEASTKAFRDLDDAALTALAEIAELCALKEEPHPAVGEEPEFDTPFWSPAPRNEAALMVPRLLAVREDEALESVYWRLLDDRVPSVRFLAVLDINLVYRKQPHLFWRVLRTRMPIERQRSIREALAGALGRVTVRANVEDVSEAVEVLCARDPDNWPEALASLVVGLALALEDAASWTALDSLLMSPIDAARNLSQAIALSVRYVTPAALTGKVAARTAAERALEWLPRAVRAASTGLAAVMSESSGEAENDQELARTLYEGIDEVVTRLSFAARQDAARPDEEPSQGPTIEFVRAIDPLVEAVLESPEKQRVSLAASTVHRFVELLAELLAVDAVWALDRAARVITAGEHTGYTLDSLAVGLVVRMVETILADYRAAVQGGEPLDDLLTVLDAFAVRGWPEAQRLVWRLEEIFR